MHLFPGMHASHVYQTMLLIYSRISPPEGGRSVKHAPYPCSLLPTVLPDPSAVCACRISNHWRSLVAYLSMSEVKFSRGHISIKSFHKKFEEWRIQRAGTGTSVMIDRAPGNNSSLFCNVDLRWRRRGIQKRISSTTPRLATPFLAYNSTKSARFWHRDMARKPKLVSVCQTIVGIQSERLKALEEGRTLTILLTGT